MFDSREDALAFRDDLVHELDRIDTDGWHVSPRLDGVDIHVATAVGRVRGHLDGAGYDITDATSDETESDGWSATLRIEP